MTQLSKNIKIRRANERGHANHGWLDANFTFSFGDYYDPEHMQFRDLRVMNNDRISPSMGFGMHPHKNMEIITYIIEGQLQHKDSMGNGSVIKKGDVQKITAGKGILHSEFNPSDTDETHLYQIWVIPDQTGLTPSYEDLSLETLSSENGLKLFASNNATDKGLHINQDVNIYEGRLKAGEEYEYSIQTDRAFWIQLVDGQLEVEGEQLESRDGMSIEHQASIKVKAVKDTTFLLFDLK